MSDIFNHEADALGSLIFGPQDDTTDYFNNKVCKYCGCECLHWEKTKRGWKLADYVGDFHVCEGFK